MPLASPLHCNVRSFRMMTIDDACALRPSADDARASVAAPLDTGPIALAAGPVVFHRCEGDDVREHELVSKGAVARAVAGLMGREFSGDFDPARRYEDRPYFVPSEALVATALPGGFSFDHEGHLLGGVVPHPFVATKAITHSLPDPDGAAPDGWSREFGEHVADAVLPGWTAFSRRDALRAGERLLADGPVRLKRPQGVGGRGQQVVADLGALASAIDAIDTGEIERDGIVIECDLDEVTTLSVGRVRVGDLLVTYCGTQELTPANDGRHVYGGSRLLVARGDWDRLLALDIAPRARMAITQARRYHDAAHACFAGLFASRSNYDVAQGVDRAGRWRSGVLEQSWRIGGATGAEIAALLAFQEDPELASVGAATVERYGEPTELPPDALLLYRGRDPQSGPLTKYARIFRDADR
jgi:hypothetical protein